MLKKIAKKIVKKYTGPPPHEQIFFSFGGPKGKKLPLGHQMEKNPLGDQRKLKLPFFKPLEELFFSWSPKGSFFPFGPPKEKKLLMGGRTGIFFLSFFGNFFHHVKKLLKFCNFLNIKVQKHYDYNNDRKNKIHAPSLRLDSLDNKYFLWNKVQL